MRVTQTAFVCLSGLCLWGCMTFQEVDGLFPGSEDTDFAQTGSENITVDVGDDSGSAEPSTGAEDSADTSISDAPEGTDETPSDVDDRPDSDTPTSSGVDPAGTDTAPDTWGQKDSASDSDTEPPPCCEDECANPCCGEQCCETPRDVCHEGTCCTPVNCEDLGASCGAYFDGCGGTLECGGCDGPTSFCSEDGACVDDCEDRVCGPSPLRGFDCGTCGGPTEYCNLSGRCVDDCLDRRCGSSPIMDFDCGTCGDEAPYCTEDGACVACLDIDDENCEGFVCDTETHSCVTDCREDDALCAAGHHCDGGSCVLDLDDGAQCDEPEDCVSGHCQNGVCCALGQTCCSSKDQCTALEAPVCSPSRNACVACAEEDLCSSQHTDKPFCDAATGRCEQCVTDDDCRDVFTAVHPSPLGICTPDHTCTCFVETSETWECNQTAECPEGMVCAQDLADKLHFVCLARCDSEKEPVAGLGCRERQTDQSPQMQLVWTPTSTCFAFDRVGDGCSIGGSNVCSVDGAKGIEDGFCIFDTCAISCWDGSIQEQWCPEGTYCRTTAPLGFCEPVGAKHSVVPDDLERAEGGERLGEPEEEKN